MYTNVCELIGIQYPIFQGAMTFVSDEYLVAAVSNAGGLGVFAPGDDSAKGGAAWLRGKIQEIKSMTSNPFGINLAMRSSRISEYVDVICEKNVKIVTTGGGDPSEYIAKLKAAGVLVAPVVPDAKTALRMEALGADLVVASGMEGGGFVGTVTTMVTLPQVTAAVKIPVIAAGGIADGRGMAAAFAMGASGVQLGTRFMLSKECTIPETVKQSMLAMKSKEAVALESRLRNGPHLRVMKNPAVESIQSYAKGSSASVDVYAAMFNAGRTEDLLREGCVEKALFPVGEVAGAIGQILSVEEIIHSIMVEYGKAAVSMPKLY